ncbi:MAG TPA: glycosyltransferase [Gammaproteobacteria bacterium]|nr:glycosyltransferase [Gammaproteobacteria bacterium]
MKYLLKRAVAWSALSVIYSATIILSKVFGLRKRKVWTNSGNILVVGTFHNPNWFFAHILPLSMSETGEIILVCDERVADVEGVTYECPPVWMSRLFSRALAKFIWTIRCGFKYRPDLYMGYHIFPAAITALIAARIFNRPSCYQDTSGPLELEGGGWAAENPLLVALGGASAWIEKLVFAVVRQFDLVIVRGCDARDFIRKTGYSREIAIITGSVEDDVLLKDLDEREYDLVFVGRLTEYKRPDQFVRLVTSLKEEFPGIRAAMIGDGPDRGLLEQMAVQSGVNESITFFGRISNVSDIVSNSKIFILTSRWEGLSIAMIEAMSVGTVAVVVDVGDLKDLVDHANNGYVVGQDQHATMVSYVSGLLNESDIWRKFSIAANKDALEMSGRNNISRKWAIHIEKLINTE